MVSLQMRVISLALRVVNRPAMATAERARRRLHTARVEPPPPPSLVARHRVDAALLKGFPVWSVRARDGRAQPAVLYLHGGAYIAPMSPQHWALVERLADAGVRVDVPLYGLAPQHTHREAYDLVLAAYARLADDPAVTAMTVMGDSAGGGLAAGVAQALAEQGGRQPDRLVLIAPWLDLTLANPLIAGVDDPWLSPVGLAVAAEAWAGGDDLGTPRLSPLNGRLTGLPPTDLYVGTRDILHPDVERFAASARDAGVQVRLTVVPGAVHVYPLVPAPEGRRERERIVRIAAGGTPD